MALDPMIFRRAAEQTKNRLVQNRIADSDYIEAKANVAAQRIIESNPVTETLAEIRREEREESSSDGYSAYRRFALPPEEESGLTSKDFQLDESQLRAVDMLVQQQYGCLIGAAGTGKTTTLRYFLHQLIYGENGLDVHMLDGKQGLNIALCAFTGIATQVIKQNMPEWLHPACKTIHSLLEYSPVSTMITQENGELKESWVFMPMRDAHNKLEHDIIVIDEASMVGVDLWHQILDACHPDTKIFLIGDLNQLPPVVSQSMFAYALSEWPVAELTHIHRQKEPAANKIVEVAHSILQGEEFEFDDPSQNHNWRVIGYELPTNPMQAGTQIVAIANALRSKTVHPSVDPEEPLVFDPYRDRVITAGNGYNESDAASAVQQAIINDALSQLIEPPSDENPRIIIDAGLSRKKFAIHHRVMATKNEPPDVEDRVTNGMVGVITAIGVNPAWEGNRNLVGPENEVARKKKESIAALFGEGKRPTDGLDSALDGLDEFSFQMTNQAQKKDRSGGGPASHSVTVEFQNGAIRTFVSKTQVDSLQLAYASTCHKCQGSQFDTAIIVCHSAVKGQLSREWLYTAVTRAQKRVVLLYTKYGVRSALARQKIFGRTLEEKIQKYKALQEETVGVLTKTKVRLYI